jgi:hypothetical protein
MSRVIAVVLSAVVWLALVDSGAAQDKAANNLGTVHEQLKADKKDIVAKYLILSDSEASAFWPVYEDYQKDLQRINERMLDLLQRYAADAGTPAFTDDKARALLGDWIALENDDAQRRATYARKVLAVLPPKKAARYLQIENEYRALLRYDLAVNVPLVQ